jgi:hypothetical protein
MAGQSDVPREIVESHTFAEQKSRAVASPKRLDELLEGVLFVVARTPEVFPSLGGISLARYRGPLDNLRVWFQYDSRTITLLGIERVAPND